MHQLQFADNFNMRSVFPGELLENCPGFFWYSSYNAYISALIFYLSVAIVTIIIIIIIVFIIDIDNGNIFIIL